MLNRNTQPFKYALYTGNPTPILDADGNRTGEYSTGYSTAAQARAYIAPATGESSIDGFGTNIDYDRIMTLSDDLGITGIRCGSTSDGNRTRLHGQAHRPLA